MAQDNQRQDWNAQAVREAGFSAVLCGLPSNVLLLSQGYWPIVGTSLALCAPDGRTALIVPEDEKEIAAGDGNARVHSFQPASLDDLHVTEDVIGKTLAEAASSIGVANGVIGCEQTAAYEPASYASMHCFQTSLSRIVGRALPGCSIGDASGMLAELRSVCTQIEVEQLRRACHVAQFAFECAGRELRPGLSEITVASKAQLPLYQQARGRDLQHLAIMSGPRSASASGAYALSSDRLLTHGELALVHCNSNIGGYWTDITRTFSLGAPSDEQRRVYEALSDARQAALDAIRPGVRAADIDRAARDVLGRYGFAQEFRHSTGHGVGFAAIDHNALPRLHPKSPDILEFGMVFNVEPAAYFPGRYGIRHCDVVAVTATGADLMTPYFPTLDELIL